MYFFFGLSVVLEWSFFIKLGEFFKVLSVILLIFVIILRFKIIYMLFVSLIFIFEYGELIGFIKYGIIYIVFFFMDLLKSE